MHRNVSFADLRIYGLISPLEVVEVEPLSVTEVRIGVGVYDAVVTLDVKQLLEDGVAQVQFVLGKAVALVNVDPRGTAGALVPSRTRTQTQTRTLTLIPIRTLIQTLIQTRIRN